MKKNLPLLLIAVLFITSCGKELEFRTKPVDQNAVSVSTLAGNGSQGAANGTATFASFYQPTGVAADTAGNVYVVDFRNNLLRKISPAGVVAHWRAAACRVRPTVRLLMLLLTYQPA